MRAEPDSNQLNDFAAPPFGLLSHYLESVANRALRIQVGLPGKWPKNLFLSDPFVITFGMAYSTSDSLLQRLKARDHVAWERFATLYSPLIYAWCRKTGLQPDDASEISSEITLSVFKSIQNYEPGRFRNWLRVVTKNRIRDFVRKKRAFAVGGSTFKGTLEQIVDPELHPLDEDEISTAQETTFLYLRAIELVKHDFSSQHFHIFKAYVTDGRDAEDVADQFGVSRDCVYKIKSRVLKRLRDEFREIIE